MRLSLFLTSPFLIAIMFSDLSLYEQEPLCTHHDMPTLTESHTNKEKKKSLHDKVGY